jgi:hypothetical protein
MQTRRRFLTTLSLAGVAGLTDALHLPAAAETLETTTVRLANDGSICIAPLFAAEELLRAEGSPTYASFRRRRIGKSKRWRTANSISRSLFSKPYP